MANWLDELAAQDDEFRRNGGELYRQLKDACSAVVDTYNLRYVANGAVVSDCEAVNPNCFRVRIIPPAGQPERFVQLVFAPQNKSIYISRQPNTVTPGQAAKTPVAPLTGSVDIVIGKDGLRFSIKKPNPSGGMPQTFEFSAAELSKEVLEPLFFPGGSRPEPVNPPKA